MELYSQLGKGSVFTFLFPQVRCLNTILEETAPSPVDEDLGQFAPVKVLAVDDVSFNLDLIQGYFAGTQHLLFFAEDGLQALELANKHLPDLILMDLRMPNMDGREALGHLRKNEATRHIPIIILTASSQSHEEEELKELCEAFLRKPFSRSQLVAELKNILPPTDSSTDIGAEQEGTPAVVATQEAFKLGENLPELLEKLQQEEETNWQQLSQTMNMREIRKFAERLRDWATEHQSSLLADYAQNLVTQIEQFDLDNLPQTLENFPEVRQALLSSNR
ncbi:MAG: response regulator [Okeania sp. SIO2D1]|nr:response regulator [Okeania sp. SIO2D1]